MNRALDWIQKNLCSNPAEPWSLSYFSSAISSVYLKSNGDHQQGLRVLIEYISTPQISSSYMDTQIESIIGEPRINFIWTNILKCIMVFSHNFFAIIGIVSLLSLDFWCLLSLRVHYLSQRGDSVFTKRLVHYRGSALGRKYRLHSSKKSLYSSKVLKNIITNALCSLNLAPFEVQLRFEESSESFTCPKVSKVGRKRQQNIFSPLFL